MRILLLDQYSDRGGGQMMLLNTLCAIRQRGWNALVALPGNGLLFEEVAALGFRTAKIDCGSYSSGRKSALDAARFVAETPRLARQIAGLVERFAPRLIYINGPRLLPSAAFARVPAPVLFHAHTGMPSAAQQWLAGIAVRELSAKVVAVSKSVAASWQRFAPVSIVYNGVRGPLCPSPPRPATPPRIGCIGRISPEKGQREFLQVASIVLQSIPNARFFIYGAALFGDPVAEQYEQKLRAIAATMPVEFPGWVDDVYYAFANLDLLLVPSVWPEPNALVILEAFAAGVPVLAFRAGGIPEFLDQLSDTPEEMARMAIAVLTSPERYEALAQAGREAWQKSFQPARYRQQITEATEEAARRTV